VLKVTTSPGITAPLAFVNVALTTDEETEDRALDVRATVKVAVPAAGLPPAAVLGLDELPVQAARAVANKNSAENLVIFRLKNKFCIHLLPFTVPA
jgi:hypothetical protein